MRREWHFAVAAFGSREPVHSVQTHQLPSVAGERSVRVYRSRPPGEAFGPLPALVWFHGGGFVVGDQFSAEGTCRALANRSGAVVVSATYRLAPEHALTASVADCAAAVEWVREHAHDLGVDPERIGVGGDSAGGALAALAAHTSQRGGHRLQAQVLVYPATDLRSGLPGRAEHVPGLLTPERMAWFGHQVSALTDLEDASLSPLRLPDFDPIPTVILTAGFDPLLVEGRDYAAAVAARAVPVEHLHYPAQIHGFLTFDRVLHDARDALDRLGASTAAFLNGEQSARTEVVLIPKPTAAVVGKWLSPARRWHELKIARALLAGRERLDLPR